MSRLVAALAVLLLGACASVTPPPAAPSAPAATTPKAPPLPRTAEPPPPPVNLSGFPLTYRQGYADGCASTQGAERKDAARYSTDGNYRTGWHDGMWQCGKKK